MKIAIYSSKEYEKPYLSDASYGVHKIKYIPHALSKETACLASGYDVISIFTNDDASQETLTELFTLGIEYIVLRCTGYNNIDIKTANKLGIKVANTPKYSPHSVAEHTLALILSLNRKITKADRRIKELNFSIEHLIGFELRGKTIGIVGTGNIGSAVCEILLGFGCNVLANDKKTNKELIEKGVKYCNLDDILKKSDVITLHVPLNKDTKYMISKDEIDKMKTGVMIINTSRGALINTQDIINGIKRNKIGYLGIDVYEEEKNLFFEDHSEDILQDDKIARLLTFQNVLITSHQAFLTDTALKNIADTTFETINSWSLGIKSKNELIH